MEGVDWDTGSEDGTPTIYAKFDGRRQRVRLFGFHLRGPDQQAALVRHAIEQMTKGILATRAAQIKRREYSELH